MYNTDNWLAIKEYFFNRLKIFQEIWHDGSPITHPYLYWIAIIDDHTAPECLALNGKIWHYQNPKLQIVIDEHFRQEIKNCRCRCSLKMAYQVQEQNIES